MHPADYDTAYLAGFGITDSGQFYSTSIAWMKYEDVPHDKIAALLTEQAEAGDEFAARALAEALRRRMTR